MRSTTRSRLLWAIAAAEMLIVLAVMPYLVPVQRFMARNLGNDLGHLPELALGGLALLTAALTLKKAGPRRLRVGVSLAASAIVLLLSFRYMTKFPIERFHYLEYTTLATLVYFAWHDRSSRKALLFKTLLLVGAIAIGEELSQSLVPSRSCSLQDATSNLLGVCYGIFIAKAVIEAALFPAAPATPEESAPARK